MSNVNKRPEERFLGHAAEIYLFITGLLVTIFSLSACIVLIYSLHKYRTGQPIANCATIFSAIFYFISSIIFISALTYFNEHDNDNFENDDNFVICIILFAVFLFLAKSSIYAQFLARLYYSFKGSLLAMNRNTIIVSVSLLCLMLVAAIWWITLIMLRYIQINRKFDGYYIQFYPVFIFLFISDFCLSWLVVGLFINKLFKTIMFRSRTDFFQKTRRNLTAPKENDSKIDDEQIDKTTMSEDVDTNDADTPTPKPDMKRASSFMLDLAFASINATDQKRLDVITRQFILSTLSIITTQLCYISFIIILILKSGTQITLNQNVLYAVLGGIFYPMEVVFNCIALFLNYHFAARYYTFWCKCCHRKCSLFVIRNASKQIVTRHSMEITQITVDKAI